MESHLDIAYIAGSKQHIGNPSFEATRCRDTSLIVTGNTEFFWGGGWGEEGGGSKKKCNHDCDQAVMKKVRICIVYIH